MGKFAFLGITALFMGAVDVYAQADNAGGAALDAVQDAVTGNLGLLVGLGMVILGLLTAILGKKPGAGVLMILGGAIFTLAPGVFNGVRDMVYGVVLQFSGGNTHSIRQ